MTVSPEEQARWTQIAEDRERGCHPNVRADGTEVPRHIMWPEFPGDVVGTPLCQVARGMAAGIEAGPWGLHDAIRAAVLPWPGDGRSYAFAHSEGPYVTNCPECIEQANA